MQTEVEPVDSEDPRALQERVLKILRVAGGLPQGPLRRDALAEVSRLRKRAIELQHRTAADIRAQIAARHPKPHLRKA
jgi:hypothetical protein